MSGSMTHCITLPISCLDHVGEVERYSATLSLPMWKNVGVGWLVPDGGGGVLSSWCIVIELEYYFEMGLVLTGKSMLIVPHCQRCTACVSVQRDAPVLLRGESRELSTADVTVAIYISKPALQKSWTIPLRGDSYWPAFSPFTLNQLCYIQTFIHHPTHCGSAWQQKCSRPACEFPTLNPVCQHVSPPHFGWA